MDNKLKVGEKVMGSEPKLTLKDMRDVDAAYQRGVKHTIERLGDGPLRLRKRPVSTEEHDAIHAGLCSWLAHDNFGMRAPGVRENLFRLSDYLSNRLPVPPKEVLLFLHAYIFALEGVNARRQIKRQGEQEKVWRPRKSWRARKPLTREWVR